MFWKTNSLETIMKQQDIRLNSLTTLLLNYENEIRQRNYKL